MMDLLKHLLDRFHFLLCGSHHMSSDNTDWDNMYMVYTGISHYNNYVGLGLIYLVQVVIKRILR